MNFKQKKKGNNKHKMLAEKSYFIYFFTELSDLFYKFFSFDRDYFLRK